MKILTTASLGSNFTGSYKTKCVFVFHNVNYFFNFKNCDVIMNIPRGVIEN